MMSIEWQNGKEKLIKSNGVNYSYKFRLNVCVMTQFLLLRNVFPAMLFYFYLILLISILVFLKEPRIFSLDHTNLFDNHVDYIVISNSVCYAFE